MKFKVVYSGECRSYAMLHHTAWHLLDFAKTHETGSLLQLKAASVFCAFTFEAYLNHVGAQEIEFWGDIERISYRSKLSVVAKHLGLSFDSGARPFQTIWALFEIRDSLAHGRTVPIDEMVVMTDEPAFDSMTRLLRWEKLTIEDVDRYFGDISNAIETINASRNTPDPLLWNEGGRTRSVSAIPSS